MKISEENSLLNGNFHTDIRIHSARYGGGFNAIGIVWDCCGLDEGVVHSQFSNLVSGDNDYFEARDYLESKKDLVFMQNKSLPYIIENIDKQLSEMIYGEKE